MPGKSRTPSLNKPAASKRKAGSAALKPQLRVSFKKSIAMGPGKADLLDAIGETGSISAAARALGMSYRRAWLLVEMILNECFKSPLVQTATGGEHGGCSGRSDPARCRPALSGDGEGSDAASAW